MMIEKDNYRIKLNKPTHICANILELSKTLLYHFHRNYIRIEYGDKVKLLFTDTNSLMI